MRFFDTETCGLMGPVILIQYADDDRDIILHRVWDEPVYKTLRLIEQICSETVCAYNLTFDWFKLIQLFNWFYLVENKSAKPIPQEIADIAQTKPKDWCLRPKGAFDLFLHVKKSPDLQALMTRETFFIKRIPYRFAYKLIGVLNLKLNFDPIFGAKWEVDEKEHDPTFVNIKLRLSPRAGLKPVASYELKQKIIDYPLPDYLMPPERPYNPYGSLWLKWLEPQIIYWKTNKTALAYAYQDVLLLQRLYDHFGRPQPNDIDSLLACAVGAARYRGFNVDTKGINERMEQNKNIVSEISSKVDIDSPIQVRKYLKSVATPKEAVLIYSTADEVLEKLESFPTAVGEEAKKIRRARSAEKELNILRKLLRVNRFCPDFRVIGTRTGRMAGGGGTKYSINPQGIPRSKVFRRLFTLKDTDTVLYGGDFDQFEVTIADATYQDPNLREDLLSGKSFHGLLGHYLFNVSYDEILASKGTSNDYYTPAKTSSFGLFYGAQPYKIAKVAGIPQERSEQVFEQFYKKYPRIRKARQIIFDAFCSMRQPKGLGTNVEWHEPANHIETLLGFKRYFYLENNIVRVLFELAQNPPKEFDNVGEVVRRLKKQTPRGALQSALFACAFQVQAHNMRAAANTVIQGTGAEITKGIQLTVWKCQPIGVHKYKVITLNIHDEIMAVCSPGISDLIDYSVKEKIDEYKKVVPLLKLQWKAMSSWGDK